MSLTQALIYAITGLSSITLGSFALFQNIKSRGNTYFFLLTCSQLFWIITLYFAYFISLQPNPNLDISIIFFRLAYGFGILMTSWLAVFFYFFPRVIIKIPKILRYFFMLLIASAFFIAAFTPLVHESQYLVNGVYRDSDIFGPLYVYYNAFNLFLFAVSIGLASQKLFLLQGIDKAKMAISAIGGWTFILVATLTNVVAPMLGIWNIGFIDVSTLIKNSPVFTLFFIIPTFYAMHKYRFFNFSNTSLNLLKKLLTYGAFLIILLWTYSLTDELISFQSIRIIVSGLIGVILFKQIEDKVPNLSSTSFRHFKKTITELKGKIYYCNNYSELQRLIEKSFLIELNFLTTKVFVLRRKNDKLRIPIYKEDHFTHIIEQYAKDGITKEELNYRKLKGDANKILEKKMKLLEADLVIPLFSEKNLIGIWILKHKNNDQPYSKEILDELLNLKSDLEIGLMNILIKMNLQEENNLMKSIIEKKTKELKKKIEEINELLKQQSDFIAVTAHEFRTPLSIATFQMEDVLNSMAPMDNKMQDLKNVDASLTNLKMLTEKLFAVQQYDLKKVQLNRVQTNMNEYVSRIYHDFQPIMRNKKIHFDLKIDFEEAAFSKIDHLQMRQVLHNLLTNASKFTPGQGKVTLRLMKRDKGQLVIKVEDNGDGIPDDLKASIFEKFRTKAAGTGIGLGLYLCKKIVELHKGKLWVEDSPKGGASFCLQLQGSVQ